ncbi:MAG TPA: hypothetical protein VGE22_11060 [Solimonas sp.]
MNPCARCPVAADCHAPDRPVAVCEDRSGFWSLQSRQDMEALRGQVYQPVRGRGIDHQRERLEAAAAELRAAGYIVQAPGAAHAGA